MKKQIAATLFLLAFLAVPCHVAQGLLVDGNTLVPIRGVYEELSFTIDWDNDVGAALIKDDSNLIYIEKEPMLSAQR